MDAPQHPTPQASHTAKTSEVTVRNVLLLTVYDGKLPQEIENELADFLHIPIHEESLSRQWQAKIFPLMTGQQWDSLVSALRELGAPVTERGHVDDASSQRFAVKKPEELADYLLDLSAMVRNNLSTKTRDDPPESQTNPTLATEQVGSSPMTEEELLQREISVISDALLGLYGTAFDDTYDFKGNLNSALLLLIAQKPMVTISALAQAQKEAPELEDALIPPLVEIVNKNSQDKAIMRPAITIVGDLSMLAQVEVLKSLPPKIAQEILGDNTISWDRKALILQHMSPKNAAAILAVYDDPVITAMFLTERGMPTDTVVKILEELSPKEAQEVLWCNTFRYADMAHLIPLMSPTAIAGIFSHTSTSQAVNFLVSEAAFGHLAAQLMELLPSRETQKILWHEDVSPEERILLLDLTSPEYAAEILTFSGTAEMVGLFTGPHVAEDISIKMLAKLSMTWSPEIVGSVLEHEAMPPERSAKLLMTVEPIYAARVLQYVTTRTVATLLSHASMPAETMHHILYALPPDFAGEVLSHEAIDMERAQEFLRESAQKFLEEQGGS